MKVKLAALIVRFRAVILAAMLLLAAFSASMIGKTNINYDLTRYLSPDTMTRRALTVMEQEFGSTEQLRLMFPGISDDRASTIASEMSTWDEVRLATFDPETGVAERDGETYHLVNLTLNDCDATQLIQHLRQLYLSSKGIYVGGSAARSLDLQNSIGSEISNVMLISVLVVLLVLLLTSHAWLEPVVILITLAVSIVINMGTNFIFVDVSFITFAVCAILQLALSIDYAIMLLHTYNARVDDGLPPTQAMTEALAECFMRIASSALTTVAGLLSLLFMSFTIGFDIGLVLSKGIIISMLGVFLMMPAVTLMFAGPLQRTRHRPIQLGGARLASGVYAARVPICIVLIVAVAAGAYAQSRNSYTFTDAGQNADTTQSGFIDSIFGANDPIVLLVPVGDEDADYDRQRELVSAIQAIQFGDEPAVRDVTAMVTTGAAALEYYTAQDVAELTGMNSLLVNLFFMNQGFGSQVRADRLLAAADSIAGSDENIAALRRTLEAAQTSFNGPNYARMLVNLNLPTADSRVRQVIDRIQQAAQDVYGTDYYITGTPMSSYDIGNAFEGDLMKVNIITALAIFLIVALSFRSAVMPLALVFVIEGAIWITMAISKLMGQSIFFMSYLICVSIQMGATIDYGILFSDQYRTLLRGGLDAKSALCQAMRHALPTILTSGLILITAGYIVGKMCSIYYIYTIGALLARGAAVSVVMVLTLLSALLSIFRRVIK